ncbi:hypothetical protein HYS00_01815 [Candidatus Microgenomates bacterium]|nr:hypothetical protein [Candidatus Microgenomates bacterium]
MSTITPQDYFHRFFRDDFYEFIRGAKVHERDGYLFIPIQNLQRARLLHIPDERVPMFYFALSLTTLIDIIIENYFAADYAGFQHMTQYPKFEHGVSGLRVGPWQLAELDFKPATFKQFCRFFLDDQKDFFTKREFKEARWAGVVKSMLADPDITQGRAGTIFVSVLKQHTLN